MNPTGTFDHSRNASSTLLLVYLYRPHIDGTIKNIFSGPRECDDLEAKQKMYEIYEAMVTCVKYQ